jgi:hypothetical protein
MRWSNTTRLTFVAWICALIVVPAGAQVPPIKPQTIKLPPPGSPTATGAGTASASPNPLVITCPAQAPGHNEWKDGWYYNWPDGKFNKMEVKPTPDGHSMLSCWYGWTVSEISIEKVLPPDRTSCTIDTGTRTATCRPKQ